MSRYRLMGSCAIVEIASCGQIRDPLQYIKDLHKATFVNQEVLSSPTGRCSYSGGASHFIWSYAQHNDQNLGGEGLAKEIEKQDIGPVTRSAPNANPVHGSGSIMTVYVWAPNEKWCRDWKPKEEPKKEAEDPAVTLWISLWED